MQRSSNEQFGPSSFPLKTTNLPDGRVKVTCTSMPAKEWFGEDEISATRHARNEIDVKFAKEGLAPAVKWAKDFGAKPISPAEDWMKD